MQNFKESTRFFVDWYLCYYTEFKVTPFNQNSFHIWNLIKRDVQKSFLWLSCRFMAFSDFKLSNVRTDKLTSIMIEFIGVCLIRRQMSRIRNRNVSKRVVPESCIISTRVLLIWLLLSSSSIKNTKWAGGTSETYLFQSTY